MFLGLIYKLLGYELIKCRSYRDPSWAQSGVIMTELTYRNKYTGWIKIRDIYGEHTLEELQGPQS